MKNPELTSLVQKICGGNYAQSDLVSFINLAQKISLSYLKYQEVLGKRITGERLDTTVEIEDLSIDCIAELFCSDGKGNFPQLQKYFNPFINGENEITDSEVLILLRRLIVRKTKQELSRIFRERDPEGAKIVRNIKVAVRNSQKLRVFQDMGKEFVFYTNGFELEDKDSVDMNGLKVYLRRALPPVPEEMLDSRFMDIYNPNDSVANTIRKLLMQIHSLSDYRNFIALDVIVKLMRNVKFEAFREKMNSEENVPTPLDNLESKEIEGFIDIVMRGIWGKINSLYVDSGKLDAERAKIYSNALRDVLYDLIQKKDSSSYYRNLRFYLPELTQREYRKNERSVFEYLAKVAKREFREHLKELL
ncbi:hypothetical protein A2V82_08565 [candidate division KSB1 bacterium RBG_16_48_16]|nr:MAG: hypothetical protein A2V82_08565 [candidate division KSB1 bacterium RBG_16_48_16]